MNIAPLSPVESAGDARLQRVHLPHGIEIYPRSAALPRSPGTRLRAFLVLLAHGNLVLATSMAAATWMVQVLAGLPAKPVASLIVFLVFYSIYSLDRAADAGADGRTHPERARFSRRNARLLRGSALAAYGAGLALAAVHGPWSVAVALLPLAGLLVYSFPVLPPPVARRVGFSRIKEVLVLKNVHVALILAGTATLLPVAIDDGSPSWKPLAGAGAFLFARWWINTLVFDLRDEAGDRLNGIRTVPVVLRRARTLRLLHAANALLAVLLIAAALWGLLPPRFALLATSCVYAWAYLRRIAAGGDEHFLCDVVADGELLVMSAVVWIANV